MILLITVVLEIDQCTFRHPARVGRCLRCGSAGHQLSTCRRPRRDSKGPAKAKPEAKAQSKPRPRASPGQSQQPNANVAWAQGAGAESSVTTEEVTGDASMTESQPQNDYPQTAPSQPTVVHLDDASMTIDDARRILIEHPLPKALQRTNVCTDEYIPQGRLFGAFATRGEGITQATFRFPLAVAAIMCLAATRGAAYSDEGFLSAQLNCSTSLPIHQDKNNHGD